MRRPRVMLVAAVVLTLLPLGGIARLRRDTDGQAMVPRGDEAIRIDREVRGQFGLRDQLVILFDTGRRDGIFDARVLEAVQRVSDAIIDMPEIGRVHVTGLRTEARDRLFAGWGVSYRDFLTPQPVTPRQLAELREDLEKPAARLYRGTIVTAERGGVAILAGVPPHGEADREALYHRIDALVAPFRRDGLRIDVAGAPAAEATLASYILRDIAVLVPLSMLVIAIVIWRGTRRVAAVGIALVKAGACIAFTFGVLGWLGVPVYLTVAIVPVVLAAMCIADEIHIFTHVQRVPLRDAFDQLATPVVAATLTTCAGFLSCLPSRIAPIQALGAAAAIGIAYSLLFTLFVTPALLVLFGTGRAHPTTGAEGMRLHTSKALVLALAIVTVAAAAMATRVRIQDSWIDNFSRRSAFRQSTDHVNARLFGVHRLEAHLSFDRERAFTNAEVLRAMDRFEAGLRVRGDVGGVIGPSSQLATVADFWNVSRDAAEATLMNFDWAPGQYRRHRVIADGYADGVVTIFLKHANYRDTAAVMQSARELHARHLAPLGSSLRFAGDVAVSQAMIPAVIRNQLLSLPLALAGVFVLVVLLCGSLRLALLAILPVAISGVWLLGALGAFGIPVGVASSMFFVIAIGLGVDSHSIHLVLRYAQDGERALSEVTRPIVINTVAVAAGFGLLAFSSVPANRTLGILIAAALLLGCFITLTAVPALLIKTSNREEDRKREARVLSGDWRTS